MARTNHPVYQVLVTKDNAPLVVSGKNVMELLPGQLGIFNYDSGLSVDFTDNTTMRRVFLAVGRDNTGDGVTDEVVKSAGEYIEVKRIHHASIQCPKDCIPQIVQVVPTNVKGDTFYTLRLSVFSTSIAMTHGFNTPTVSYTVKTGCCETTNVCSCDDNSVCSKLAYDIVVAINADTTETGLTAYLYDVANAVTVDLDDYEDWVEDSGNVDSCLAIRIMSNCEALRSFYQINYQYKKLRAVGIEVSFKEQDSNMSAATITEIQELVYEEGIGYDINQIEFEAGGWNAKAGPYRQYELVGGPLGNYDFQADKNTSYVQLVLGYDAMSISGSGEYINDLETIIAIPCEDIDTMFVGQGEGIDWMFETMLEASAVYLNPGTLPDDCCGDESSSS